MWLYFTFLKCRVEEFKWQSTKNLFYVKNVIDPNNEEHSWDGRRPSSLPSCPALFTTCELHAEASQPGCGWWIQLSPSPLKFGQKYLLSISHVIRTAMSSCKRQNPLSTTLLLPLPESRKWVRGRRLSPLGPISHIGFSALINWLHLPCIWQQGF